MDGKLKIIVVGLGYVGLSNAVLLSQDHEVIGIDVSEEKIKAVNARRSPVEDEEIEEFLRIKKLNIRAEKMSVNIFRDVGFVIIATPTNYDE